MGLSEVGLIALATALFGGISELAKKYLVSGESKVSMYVEGAGDAQAIRQSIRDEYKEEIETIRREAHENKAMAEEFNRRLTEAMVQMADDREAIRDLQEEVMELRSRLAPFEKIGIAILNPQLQYLHITPVAAEMNGITVDEHIGRSINKLFPHLWHGVKDEMSKVINEKQEVQGIVEAVMGEELKTFRYIYSPILSLPNHDLLGVYAKFTLVDKLLD